MKRRLINYFVDGSAVAKDEINGAFNIAILEIVAARVVTKSVLCAVKATS